MRLTRYTTPLMIVIMLLFLVSTAFSITADSKAINSLPPAPSIGSDLNNMASGQAITNGNHRSALYTAFSPVKILICKLKKVYQIPPLPIGNTRAVHQNMMVAIIVISLFLIYYRLSRTGSETPDASC